MRRTLDYSIGHMASQFRTTSETAHVPGAEHSRNMLPPMGQGDKPVGICFAKTRKKTGPATVTAGKQNTLQYAPPNSLASQRLLGTKLAMRE